MISEYIFNVKGGMCSVKKGIVASVCFSLIICFFALSSAISPDRAFSESENRTLTTFPSVSLSSVLEGSTQGELTTYFSHQLIFRDFLVKSKVSVEKFLGKTDIGGVYLGKDGYYIEKKTEIDESIFQNNINAISDFLNNNKNAYFLPVLTRAYYLEDKLPKGAKVYPQGECFEKIQGKCSNTISLKEKLDGDDFYKTDHHWKYSGAFKAYEEYMKTLGKTPTETKVETEIGSFLGTLYSKAPTFLTDGETISIPTVPKDAKYIADGKETPIIDKEYFNKKDKYSLFLSGNCAFGEITNLNGEGNLLIIKDSFANSFVPFLLEDFGSVSMIDTRYFSGSVSDVIKEKDITNILILCSMDSLTEEKSIGIINY